eukprot:10624222-Alexandrium_andersonii.AAC.1
MAARSTVATIALDQTRENTRQRWRGSPNAPWALLNGARWLLFARHNGCPGSSPAKHKQKPWLD